MREDREERHGSAGPATSLLKCVAVLTKLRMLPKDLLVKLMIIILNIGRVLRKTKRIYRFGGE